MFPAQRSEPSGGQPAASVVRVGIRMLDPSQLAATADLVGHAEDPLAVEERHPRAPTGPLGRDRVLPRRVQLRHARPAGVPAEPPTADPQQGLAPGLAPGDAPNLVGLGSEASAARASSVGFTAAGTPRGVGQTLGDQSRYRPLAGVPQESNMGLANDPL